LNFDILDPEALAIVVSEEPAAVMAARVSLVIAENEALEITIHERKRRRTQEAAAVAGVAVDQPAGRASQLPEFVDDAPGFRAPPLAEMLVINEQEIAVRERRLVMIEDSNVEALGTQLAAAGEERSMKGE
jgi:hypothetical protein